MAYHAALSRAPDDVRSMSNYGGLLCAMGHFTQAHALLVRAVTRAPEMADAWCNLGNALQQLQKYDEAIQAYTNCLRRNPGQTLALSNLGVALDCRGEHEAAQKFHKVAIRLDPENAGSHTNHALSLLASGDYPRGFAEYEWRWKNRMTRPHGMTAPLWKGEDFSGRTLMVHTEGGFGDMIQFARFLPLVAERGSKIVVRVRREVLGLLARCFPDLSFVTEDDPLPAHDLQCPILSLPLGLDMMLETLPGTNGFLTADPDKAQCWADRLRADNTRHGDKAPSPRIGLVWAGAPHREIREAEIADRRRSMDLATLAPLVAAVPDALFYSLQIGERASQARQPPFGMTLIDHTNHIHDFDDTAALIANLDLVIAVDTSTAHVAAALGKPVWLLSRYDQCWRWLSGRTDSPWYDSLRIYQQSKPLDWSQPLARLTHDLHIFA